MVFLKKHGVLPKIGDLNLYHVGYSVGLARRL